jgi:hypothetical protein
MTPSSSPQSSEGGWISCTGTLQGKRITGPGTFSNDGRLDNANCLVDHSLGTYRFTVPTDGGPLSVQGTYDLVRTGLTFNVIAEQPGAIGSGSGIVVPIKGDCVVTPLTEALVFLTVKFTDAPATTRICDLDLGVVQLSCRMQSPN